MNVWMAAGERPPLSLWRASGVLQAVVEMTLKIVVMVHVEPGTVRDGTIIYDSRREEGITSALGSIVDFADRVDVPMGFALTPQALAASHVDLAGHDVGLHLHPMDLVLAKRVRDRIHVDHDCLARYAPKDQAVLIHEGRLAFEEAFGRAPRLFVAGRWSEDTTTAALLRREGFTHDGSALPGHRSQCADWSRLSRLTQPYAPAADDYQARGSEPYVYFPVYQGLWGYHLTPERLLDLGVSYFKAALKEAQLGSADVVHLFFHSPLALDPGAMDAFAKVLEYARESLKPSFVRPTDLAPSPRPRSRSFPPVYWARFSPTLLKSFVGRSEVGRRIMGAERTPSEWNVTGPRSVPGDSSSGKP